MVLDYLKALWYWHGGWRWHRKLRRETGEVYMDRWQLLRSKRLSVYINRINLPDADELPHTHPWERSYSLKLKGSYVEHVYVSPDTFYPRRPGRFNRIPELHRIDSLTDGKPCWTLFIGLNVEGSWGFMGRNGKLIPHQVRKRQRGVESES